MMNESIRDGYKMTEMGKMPDEWEVVKFNDKRFFKKIKAGGTPLSSKAKYYMSGNIPFVKIEDITRSGKYLFDTKIKITNEGLNSCTAWLVPINSIIYSMYASFGEAAINKVIVATNQAIIAIIPNKNTDLEYIFYVLWNLKPTLSKYLRETTQKNLNANVVQNLQFPFPPLPEQHRIAEILTTTDTYIEKEQTYLNKLQQIKKGLMQDLLTGKVRVTTTLTPPNPAEAVT